ncbi:hypothetical protein TRFO_19003 [Tritrichomonas foetus]|uniref:Tryptophanyl-tRNA synthetase n=1 Tax=Tritrichomonas foetus TaxID=1144522 RepID=A0A1J4KP26_9EUKA|nr:hypothetical protein TRFO_19003 [Tritrichomonas foetus]|eukprot:OHT11548.1 hypothetical protein TRFO_19003 [Tritrichomonas foetus]
MSTPAPAVPLASLVPAPESFGAQPITDDLLQSYAQVTGQPAPTFLRRRVFNGHIGFEDAISRKRDGKPFYIFLSITPSNHLTNLRHIVSFRFAQQLQAAFDCPVVIHVLDSKALLRDADIKLDQVQKNTEETILDIMSFNFKPEKTVIVRNTEALNMNYILLCDLQRKSTLGSFVEKFIPNDNLSISILDVIFQNASFAVPEYLLRIFPNYAHYRCLMILRPTQKNLYDHACSLDPEHPPMAIFGGFVPALQGGQKMPALAKFALGQSGGDLQGKKQKNAIRDYMTIYLSNTRKDVTKKLNSNAFSGGRDTLALQQEQGANIDVDVSFFYLSIFEEDDAKVAEVRRTYGPGDLPEGNDKRMTTGALKKAAAEVIGNVVAELQAARKAVTKDAVKAITTIRHL